MRLSRALEEEEDVRKWWGGCLGDLHLAKMRWDRDNGGMREVRPQTLDQ